MFVSYCFALVRNSMASQHVMGVCSVGTRGKAFFIVLHTLPRLTMTAAPSSMTRFVATMHLLDSVVMIRTGEVMGVLAELYLLCRTVVGNDGTDEGMLRHRGYSAGMREQLVNGCRIPEHANFSTA